MYHHANTAKLSENGVRAVAECLIDVAVPTPCVMKPISSRGGLDLHPNLQERCA